MADSIRRAVIEQSKRANIGHIGSSLSIADILSVLFSGPLAAVNPADPHRHRFVLSKGHAALALYGALCATGRMSREALETYCADGVMSPGIPSMCCRCRLLDRIARTRLVLATGAALAARLQHSSRRVFAVLSDAECNEGSVWEAAMFAAHHRLGNLVAIIDVNGQQALGYTRDVLDLEPLANRWDSFGWDVEEVDGHDVEQMAVALDRAVADESLPHVILARTVFGKGVSFMEQRIEWHYLPMSDDEYALALAELSGSSG